MQRQVAIRPEHLFVTVIDLLKDEKKVKIIDVLQQKQWATIFVVYLRYLIGGAFVFAAIVKIQGGRFTTDDGSTAPIDSAWHLFETLYRSGTYWKFLGWGQLIAGFLLMTQRFATLGALIFFPVTLNIFFITMSYSFGGTPIITGLLVLATIFLLLWDYNKLLPLLQTGDGHIIHNYNKIPNNSLWTSIGVLLFLITVIYVLIWERNPGGWILLCIAVGLSALILHFIRQRRK